MSVCAGTSPMLSGVLVAVTCTRSMKFGVTSSSTLIWAVSPAFTSIAPAWASRNPGARTTTITNPGGTLSMRNRPVVLTTAVRGVPSRLTTAPGTGCPLCLTATDPANAPAPDPWGA